MVSHTGTPKGRRDIIAMGEVNGITDSQNASAVLGFWIIDIEAMIPIITGMVATDES